MTYPAYGDPVYLTKQNGGDLPGGLYLSNLGECPTGMLSSDVVVGAVSGVGLEAMKVNSDGTITVSGTATSIPDPGGSGSSLLMVPPNDAPGYYTIDTTALGGGSYTINVRKFVADPSTLAITQQAIVGRTFTSPYSFTPQLNPLAGTYGAVVSLDDYTSSQTSHEFQILPITSGGLGSYINVTLDSTGLSGFDGGAPIALTNSAYYTLHDRFWSVSPTGTIVHDIQAGDTTMVDIDNNFSIFGYGCVSGLFFATGGATPDALIEVNGSGVVTGTTLLDDIVVDAGGDFTGETWVADALWTTDGTVYMSASTADGVVGSVTTDPLGTPSTVFMRESDGSSVYPGGFTADGRVFAYGQNAGATAQHYSVYAMAAPGPAEVIRNLVINPSGEQAFDRAWTASNGIVETNVLWEV